MHVRELAEGETALAYGVMSQLRPAWTSAEGFVRVIDDIQRPQGYRLVASFDEDDRLVSVLGFRSGHSLAWGRYCYVDGLVTAEGARGRGHAGALLEWLAAEAARMGCGQIHLDSGTRRHAAHRLVSLREGFVISSFHFAKEC
ncbi:MAG: GNAT family N-acetyltransferase [Actinomycetota bacterium]|nr:GNAT family N-acetyltransferase [Actinomycetota bacterium]